MTFNRNQKYMIFLLAFMAFGISSFSTGSAHRAGHADFASEVIASPDQDEVNDFTQQVESNTFQNPATLAEGDDISVQASDVRQEQDGVKVKLAVHMTDDDGNDSTSIEKDVFAQNVKELKKILPKRIKAIQKQALAKAKKEKDKKAKEDKRAEDVKNCKVKIGDDGKRYAINENNVREKLKCFAEQEQELTGDNLQDYKDSIVQKYISERMTPIKEMVARDGVAGAMSARASVAQLQGLLSQNGLEDQSMASQFSFINNVISARIPANQNIQGQLFAQYQAGLMNSNPQVRAAALQQYRSALQMQKGQAIISQLGQVNSLSAMPASMDSDWNKIAATTRMQLQSNIQQEVYGDKNLTQVFGSFIAPYKANTLALNNSALNASTLSALNTNPFNSSNIFGNNGLDPLSLNSPWMMTDAGATAQFWQSTPPTGSNMANPAIPQPPVTAVSATGKKVAVNR